MTLLGYERAMDYYQTPLQSTINGEFQEYQRSYYWTNFPLYSEVYA